MPLTTLVLIAVIVGVVLASRRDSRQARTGWRWFALWILPGFLAAFSTLSFAIGLLLLPLAVAAVVLAARVAMGAEMLGLLPGIGAMCFLIALLNVGEDTSVISWLVAGAAFTLAGVACYAAVLQRGGQLPSASG